MWPWIEAGCVLFRALLIIIVCGKKTGGASFSSRQLQFDIAVEVPLHLEQDGLNGAKFKQSKY